MRCLITAKKHSNNPMLHSICAITLRNQLAFALVLNLTCSRFSKSRACRAPSPHQISLICEFFGVNIFVILRAFIVGIKEILSLLRISYFSYTAVAVNKDKNAVVYSQNLQKKKNNNNIRKLIHNPDVNFRRPI